MSRNVKIKPFLRFYLCGFGFTIEKNFGVKTVTYEEILDYIKNIPKFVKKNEPEVTKAFLKEIGDFSKDIPTVHVAGTNGKGSVCAFLNTALTEQGFKTCMFTSPHLIDIRERFSYNNEMISKEEFTGAFNEVMSKLEAFVHEDRYSQYHPSYFELLFMMMAAWINRLKPDVVILETGLGGRLDATNSIESPKLCVITEIGLDHCKYLGDTKPLIAAEKAGIIVHGVPVIFIDKEKEVSEVFLETARSKDAPIYPVSLKNIKNCERTEAGIDFWMHSLYHENVKFLLKTSASYQVENAAIAYTAIEVLKDLLFKPIDMEKASLSFGHMKWPGRMERLSDRFFFDGAHNPDGIRAFLDTVKYDGADKRLLLYTAVSDKDIDTEASMIINSNLFDSYCLCKLEDSRGADKEQLLKAFEKAGNVSFYNCVKSGFESLPLGESKTVCYAAGSLYLYAEIKALL